jgi:hypothetical protein
LALRGKGFLSALFLFAANLFGISARFGEL